MARAEHRHHLRVSRKTSSKGNPVTQGLCLRSSIGFACVASHSSEEIGGRREERVGGGWAAHRVAMVLAWPWADGCALKPSVKLPHPPSGMGQVCVYMHVHLGRERRGRDACKE